MKKKISDFDKNQIVEIINDSKSFREVLKRLNYSSNGSGGYSSLKKQLLNMNIDIPKYNHYGEGSRREKIDLKDILVENSEYQNRSALKKRLVKEGILEYKCAECDNNGEWNGKKLTLQLEHKNGINNDNRIENLVFLCPNCHSQTNTYGGRNNKVIISDNVKNQKLEDIKKRRRKVVDRPCHDDLIEMISISSMEAVGRKYGVSGNAVKKWLR